MHVFIGVVDINKQEKLQVKKTVNIEVLLL